MILAILRAQLLSLRSFGRGRAAGAVLSAIPAIFFYGLWTMFAIGGFTLMKLAGNQPEVRNGFPIGLLCVFLYWQIAPVITASMGASLDLQKLIVYPINLDKLFTVEVMLRFLTVGEMLIVLTGTGLGILFNPALGGFGALPRVFLGFLLFVAFNLLVAAGVRSLIERAMKQKRLRELFMFGFVLVCVMPSVVLGLHIPLERFLPYLPVQTAWPWGAASVFALGSNVPSAYATASVGLLVWIFAGYRFGRRQFYRALRADPYSGSQGGARSSAKSGRAAGSQIFDRLFRLPSRVFRDPLGNLVEKDLRTLSRCAGFRLAFLMGFTFGILIFLPQVIGKHTTPMREHFLAWVSVYSVLLAGYYTFWNAFGYDRSAAQFYFAAPIPFRQVLFAKNIAASICQLLELVILTLVFAFIPVPLSAFTFQEAYAVTAVACLYLFALGNITSVRSPLPIDPDKMGRGSSGRSAALLSMLIFPVAFLPIALAYWGRYVFKSDTVFFLLLLLAGIIGAVFYWVGTDSAVNSAQSRREQMIASLSKGEGPLSAT